MGHLGLFATKWNSWVVMLTGALGTAWGLDLVTFGQTHARRLAIGFGQVFMVLSAVVGGALISAAFTELRVKRRKDKDGVP